MASMVDWAGTVPAVYLAGRVVPPGRRREQPGHGLVDRARPARAQWLAGRAVLGPGQNRRARAGSPCCGPNAQK
jgi:hypothetical protein